MTLEHTRKWQWRLVHRIEDLKLKHCFPGPSIATKVKFNVQEISDIYDGNQI